MILAHVFVHIVGFDPQHIVPGYVPLQVERQPIESLRPSSQVSLPTVMPSPQISTQTDVDFPVQFQPGRGPEQSGLQPVKGLPSLSSHFS